MLSKYTNKLSAKLLISLLLGIILPVGILCVSTLCAYTKLMKKELHLNTEKTLSYCWQNIEDILTGMVTVSSIINNDIDFTAMLSDDTVDTYNKTIAFDHLLQSIYLQNFGLDETSYIYLENVNGEKYCNQNKYSIIPGDFALEGAEQLNSVLFWDFYALDLDTNQRCFSMTRSLYKYNRMSTPLGKLVITVPEQQIKRVLDDYVNLDVDCVLLYLDSGEFITGFHRGTTPAELLFSSCYKNIDKITTSNYVQRIEGKNYLINDHIINKGFRFNGNRMHVLVLTDSANLFGHIAPKITAIAMCMIVVYVLIFFVGFFVPKRIISPIQQLDSEIRNYHVGDSIVNNSYRGTDEISSLYQSFFNMTEEINRLFVNLKEESAIKENYRYQSLRAQINPHFIFNTLNSIKFSAQIIHADSIVDNIDALSKMLRYSMQKTEDSVPVHCEIENIQNYLQIQNNRFGNSIHLELGQSINLYRDNLVYKFILQPIVENSILHGFKDYTDQGVIFIDCYEKDNCFYITIQDNGRGFSEDALKDWQTINVDAKATFTGLGLPVIQKIIKISCGEQYGLTVNSTPYEGTEVIFTLPIQRNVEETDL